MYEHTKTAGALQNEYFREPKFSNFMRETEVLFKKALFAPDEYFSMFLSCSGTGAMEATVINCFTSRDKLLIINGGTFGEYFVNISRYNQIPHEEIVLKHGEVLTEESFAPYDRKNYTALLVNICETSTGQIYDMNLIVDFCRRNQMYLIVDAISSAFADEYDIGKYAIDASIVNSQKGLALPPGLAMVILSNRLYEERVANNQVKSMYFDFKEYVTNMERGQTPFTPCIGLLYQLNDMLRLILEQGIHDKIKKTHELAVYFRRWAIENDIKIPSYPLSNALTPVIFDDINACRVYEKLRDDHDIYINPNRYMSERICRVGHLGNLSVEDIDLLIIALKQVIQDLSENR
jgi:aspartate aminotransferase-like enzyme